MIDVRFKRTTKFVLWITERVKCLAPLKCHLNIAVYLYNNTVDLVTDLAIRICKWFVLCQSETYREIKQYEFSLPLKCSFKKLNLIE